MPLDPSIFLQGAALKAQRDAQLGNTIANAAQGYIASKQKKDGLDLDNLVQGVLLKKAAGQELTPQDLAIGKAWDMQNSTKLAYDPAGNPRPASTSIFGGGPMSGGSVPMPGQVDIQQLGGNEFPGVQTAGPGFDLGYLDGAALPMPQGVIPAPNKNAVAMDFGNNAPAFPVSANPGMMIPLNKSGMPPQPAPIQNAGLNLDALAPAPAPQGLRAPVVYNNPAATQKGLEAAATGTVELQKRAAEADISASEAGATKRAQLTQENAVNEEAKIKGLLDLEGSIDQLILDAQGTPSGVLQGAAATISSLAGKPNKQALARSKFESGKALSSLQSRIAFLKGQGTITEGEAKTAMGFIPDANDPIEIKVQKLNSAKEYIKLLTGTQTQSPSGPGFRYLGVKK